MYISVKKFKFKKKQFKVLSKPYFHSKFRNVLTMYSALRLRYKNRKNKKRILLRIRNVDYNEIDNFYIDNINCYNYNNYNVPFNILTKNMIYFLSFNSQYFFFKGILLRKKKYQRLSLIRQILYRYINKNKKQFMLYKLLLLTKKISLSCTGLKLWPFYYEYTAWNKFWKDEHSIRKNYYFMKKLDYVDWNKYLKNKFYEKQINTGINQLRKKINYKYGYYQLSLDLKDRDDWKSLVMAKSIIQQPFCNINLKQYAWKASFIIKKILKSYTKNIKLKFKSINLETKFSLIIRKTKNNWFFTLTNYNGIPILIQSCGILKPKTKKEKRSKEIFEELYELFFSKCFFLNNLKKKLWSVYYKSNSKQIKRSFKIKKLFKKYKRQCNPVSFYIKRIKTHNGLRKKKLRRI